MTETLNAVVDATVSEDVPSLVEYAEEAGGAWPNGWYAAEVIEGYATAKGHQFETADAASKDGSSRNMRLCFNVSNGKDVRTMQESYNYRANDFSTERISYIKQLREENKNEKHWADKDAQRSSLAIAKLGQIQKSLLPEGQNFKRSPEGGLLPAALIGNKSDVRLGTDEKGYNVITAFAPAGTKVKR